MPLPVTSVLEVSDIRRLLLVKLSSLGDVIHTLPLLESLREGFGPNVPIGWAVRAKFAAILDGNPHLTASYTLSGNDLPKVLTFGKSLRQQSFDVALDAQGLLVSGLVTALSGAGRRIGWDLNREGNRLFLTHPVVPGRQRAHIVDKLMGFCDEVGIPRAPVRSQTYLAVGEKEKASELLAHSTPGTLVGCIIGASTPEKTYPVAQWVAVLRLLRDAGLCPVLLGGEGEKLTARQIVEEAKGAVVLDLTGKTPLRVLASVLASCSVVVGGDSGPTHLAVAVGTPVVGLYGVTDPVRTGPNWGQSRAIVLDYAEKDAPAAMRRPRHPTINDALARIPPDAVAGAVQELLDSPRK